MTGDHIGCLVTSRAWRPGCYARWGPPGYFSLTEKCFLLLGIYSIDGSGTTRQVREWLALEGEQQTSHEVKEALRALARRRQPLVAKVRQGAAGCEPSLWRYTDAGRALFVED